MNNKVSTKGRFAIDAGWQIASQIYSMFFSLVIGALTARYLGPSNYGYIGYSASLVALFTSVSTLGMEGVVVNDLVNKPNEAGVTIGTALCMRTASSLLSMGCVTILVSFIEPGNSLLRLITVLHSIALVLNTTEVLGYWFKSQLETKYISIGSIVATTAVGAWRVILLLRGTTVEFFSASTSIQALTSGIVLIVAFRKRHGIQLSFNSTTAWNIIKRSHHFILSGIAIVLYTQVDKVMLGKMLGELEVGFYSAATMVATMWQFIPLALINSARTLIFQSKESNEKEYKERLQILLLGVSLLGIAVALFFTLFGDFVLVLLYGEDYRSSIQPMKIIVWSSCFAMLGSARGSWIIAEGLNRYSKHYVFISSIVNVVLNYFLIPLYGTLGAAIATLVSQVTTVFVAPALFPATRPFIKLYFSSFSRFNMLMRLLSKRENKGG